MKLLFFASMPLTLFSMITMCLPVTHFFLPLHHQEEKVVIK